jgi:hypothetical protein
MAYSTTLPSAHTVQFMIFREILTGNDLEGSGRGLITCSPTILNYTDHYKVVINHHKGNYILRFFVRRFTRLHVSTNK